MALEGITVLLCQKQRHFCGLDSDMCSKHGVTNQGMIFSFFFLRQTKWKTPDKFWFSLQGIPPLPFFFFLHAFHKPEDIHINTDMVEQQNIWKWHGWKATTWQTFNSLVCGPPWKHLTWVELLLQITPITCWLSFPGTVESTVHIGHLELHTQKAFSVTELTQVGKTYSASFSSI